MFVFFNSHGIFGTYVRASLSYRMRRFRGIRWAGIIDVFFRFYNTNRQPGPEIYQTYHKTNDENRQGGMFDRQDTGQDNNANGDIGNAGQYQEEAPETTEEDVF